MIKGHPDLCHNHVSYVEGWDGLIKWTLHEHDYRSGLDKKLYHNQPLS